MKKIALDVEYDPKRDLWMISSPHIDKRKIKEVFVVDSSCGHRAEIPDLLLEICSNLEGCPICQHHS